MASRFVQSYSTDGGREMTPFEEEEVIRGAGSNCHKSNKNLNVSTLNFGDKLFLRPGR